MDKNSLRKYMKEIRSEITLEIKNQYDKSIYNKLINSEYYNNAKTIFIYVSFGSEVDTHKIINHALENKKTVCVPKVLDRSMGMKAVKINSIQELKESSFGVLEPEGTEYEVEPKEIDLLLIPGLAFDRTGGRLGYGAGYYDRFITQLKDEANKIGVAYSFQLLDEVPMEEHDMFIQDVITN